VTIIIILILLLLIIIIIIHKTIFIVLSTMAQSHMREFTLGPLSEVGQHQVAANLTFESACCVRKRSIKTRLIATTKRNKNDDIKI